MTEAEKAARLMDRIGWAARDVLASLERVRDGGGRDDVQIMLESARDAYSDAFSLALAGGDAE